MLLLLYVCAGVCGRLECKDVSPGSCASIDELLVGLESFRKPLCLAVLQHTRGKNVGFRRRLVVEEVRRLVKYSLIKRGSMGKHPTMIPVPISAHLEGKSVCTNMIVEICLPYDHTLIRPKSYPTAGLVSGSSSISWHL